MEFSKFGRIDALHVCDNLGDHMIGHVYCKFTDEEDASDALQVMNDRYYDGRKMEVEFSPVQNFQEVRTHPAFIFKGDGNGNGSDNEVLVSQLCHHITRLAVETSMKKIVLGGDSVILCTSNLCLCAWSGHLRKTPNMIGVEKKMSVGTRKGMSAELVKGRSERGEMIGILRGSVRGNHHGDQEVDRSVRKVLVTTTTTMMIAPTKSKSGRCSSSPLLVFR